MIRPQDDVVVLIADAPLPRGDRHWPTGRIGHGKRARRVEADALDLGRIDLGLAHDVLAGLADAVPYCCVRRVDERGSALSTVDCSKMSALRSSRQVVVA